jgi:hypothetical protein
MVKAIDLATDSPEIPVRLEPLPINVVAVTTPTTFKFVLIVVAAPIAKPLVNSGPDVRLELVIELTLK